MNELKDSLQADENKPNDTSQISRMNDLFLNILKEYRNNHNA